MHATATILTEAYGSSLSSHSVYEAPAIADAMDRVYESEVQDRSPVKGMIVALGMEAATALLLGGARMAWHFIR